MKLKLKISDINTVEEAHRPLYTQPGKHMGSASGRCSSVGGSAQGATQSQRRDCQE